MKIETTREYRIICYEHLIDLEREVNLSLKSGWRPTGGMAISITQDRGNSYRRKYAQAMVRTIRKFNWL